MKLITIKIRGFKDKICGILLSEDNDWYVVLYNEVDFVLNGVLFVQKKHVICLKTISHDDLLYRILYLKFLKLPYSYKDINVKDIILSSINTKELIGITCHKENSMYVGHIEKMNKKSFVLMLYSVTAKPLYISNIKLEKVRYFSVKTDYLDSLKLYINSVLS